MTKQYNVVAVGNAIVDILTQCKDAILIDNNLPKGGMMLVTEGDAFKLYDLMGTTNMASGGSAANTIAGVASFGGTTGFIGKVADDQFGSVFSHDMKAIGVDFDNEPLKDGLSTARCMIFITPDAQRTMCTFLGASTELCENDLNIEMLETADVVYLEGYLFDKPLARSAFFKAAEIAHNSGKEVALSLSDSFCVERHKAEFLKLVTGHVDILFANEDEIKALFDKSSVEEAAVEVSKYCKLGILTKGSEGSVIIFNGEEFEIPVYNVEKVVDTTGAGDLYAAGFLYGYTNGYDLSVCGRLGALAAGEVISHVGARPLASLAELFEQKKDWVLKG